MMACFMAAVMMVSVGCKKDPIATDGVLPGLFSVSETQQVHFSMGNLQYQASTDTWRFTEHQYDYIGSDNSSISSSYSGWIDLFGWGTSGWNSGAVCYQPWSTSDSYSDYYPGGSSTNGLTGTYAEADWAWHNAISNGGNTAHQWRTLTNDEWIYLLRARPNASDKCGMGYIKGVCGLIILPDNWTLPSGCSFISGFASGDDLGTNNNYPLSQWSKMEANGAVFLPAASGRNGYEVSILGHYGSYWSSAPNNERRAYHMYFYAGKLFATDCNYRSFGFSVRPVQD